MVRIPFRQLGALVLVLCMARSLLPCPFCSAISSTLSQDIRDSHWAFLAVCTQSADIHDDNQPPIHKFRLIRQLKATPVRSNTTPSQSRDTEKRIDKPQTEASKPRNDGSLSNATAPNQAATLAATDIQVKLDDSVEVYSLYQYSRDQIVLLLGNTADGITDWSASEPLSPNAQEYLPKLVKLSEQEGDNRLRFFLPQLRSADKMIATDAYNEFAVASLELMNSLKPHLVPEQVVEVIESPDTSNEVRRLYWTLLGICGSSKNLDVVERALQANLANGNGDVGMDAVFSCYLVLGGEQALEKLEQEYLRNPNSSYTNCFALVSALRVQAEQIKAIQPDRICRSFREALGRGSIAELVIPDLARWEDWTVIDPLMELFSRPTNGEKQSYKIPIINYLRNCPLDEAQVALAKCEQIDPEAVRKTSVLFPLRK